MNKKELIIEKLRAIIFAPERLLGDDESIEKYIAPSGDALRVFCVVKPRNEEEATALIRLANAAGFALYSPLLEGLSPVKEGVVVDLGALDDGITIDERNLQASVPPAVTFSRLQAELDKVNCRVFMPASTPTESVLLSYLEREILFAAGRYTNKQLMIVHALLADGRLYKGGSHALPNATVSHREDGGPNLSKLLYQSKNSFGIPVRAVINIYPRFQSRLVIAFGFKDLKSAAEVSRVISNEEQATECFVANKTKLIRMFGEKRADGAPAWFLGATAEGSKDLAAYYAREAAAVAKANGGKDIGKTGQKLADDAFKRAWPRERGDVEFYTTYGRAASFDRIAQKHLPKDAAAMIIPVKRGTTVYMQYGAGGSAGAAAGEFCEKLLDKGAFFTSPTGDFAQKVLERTGNYHVLLKQIKNHIDKNNILNPDQMIKI
ncbi:MAG: FAD-binding oxidoreductase [bacterium]